MLRSLCRRLNSTALLSMRLSGFVFAILCLFFYEFVFLLVFVSLLQTATHFLSSACNRMFNQNSVFFLSFINFFFKDLRCQEAEDLPAVKILP